MRETAVIKIEISGPVQSGKSAIAATIRDVLEDYGLCVAFPNREQRNSSDFEPLDKAADCEKPKIDRTVIVVTEQILFTVPPDRLNDPKR